MMNSNLHRLIALYIACMSMVWGISSVVADEQVIPPVPASADSSQFIPPDDGHDWLQLTSGEWLKGELIGLFEDKVEFDSEILDKLVLDAEDVKSIHSERRFGIQLRGEEATSGRLYVDGDEVVVDTGQQALRLARADLVAVTVAAERERDRWSGALSLGVNLRQGNSERIEYNMLAGLDRRTSSSRLQVDYIGSYNKTDEVETANDHRVNLVLDRFSGTRLFWRPIIGQYLRDPFQNIDHQVTLETGLGYDLIDNSRTDWEIYAGAGINYVRRVSVEEGQSSSSRSPAYTLGTLYETEVTDWMDYLFSYQLTFLDDESGDYQHHLVTTLSTDLVGDLDLDISFIWDRTESPPPLADGSVPEKDDFRLITGIGFEF